MIMEQLPKIFVDFNNNDVLRRIYLNTNGTLNDLNKLGIKLEEGLALLLYDLDGLSSKGIVQFSEADNRWVAVVDWDDLMNQQ